MSDHPDSRLSRWPSLLCFLLGAAMFDGLGVWVMMQSQHPLSIWHACAVIVCVAGGAWMSVQPFVWDAKAAARREEQHTLRTTLEQIHNLEKVAAQISSATNTWSFAQEQAGKTVEAANTIAQRMSEEAKGFADFMQKTNDAEKATLRLEVEKLRRSEADWVQVLVRQLDHTFALHQAGERSGQPALAQNLANFQHACRDAARMVGLVPFAAEPGEPFDPERHQFAGEGEAPAESVIASTVATGYTLRGSLIRRALVAVASETKPTTA
ncbi:MAG: nucleotide exchange factor GrpE [Verrucomicrobia bacterium]|nr:nucleotide exchange factor GrpE [Verrucomicrobiota bacterium]